MTPVIDLTTNTIYVVSAHVKPGSASKGKVYISTGHGPVAATNPQGELDVYGLK